MREGLALRALLGIGIGVAAGVGGYTFVYAKGASLRPPPRASQSGSAMKR